MILGSAVALSLTMSAAFSAASEVRVAFFLEWPTPNQEDKVKKTLLRLLEFQLNGQTSLMVEL
jgi:hypothetical protein